VRPLEHIMVQILSPLTGRVTARVNAKRCACGDVLLGDVHPSWRCPTCASDRELAPLAKALSSNTNTAVPMGKTA
jgi:hypothetical protein